MIEIIVIGLISMMFRYARRKPIKLDSTGDSLYLEKWISGRSFNFVWMVNLARYCLWVKVTKTHITIAPHLPFSLFFFPEIFGCDVNIEKEKVVSAKNSLLFGVLIKYNENGKLKEFSIHPRYKQKLIDAIYA